MHLGLAADVSNRCPYLQSALGGPGVASLALCDTLCMVVFS